MRLSKQVKDCREALKETQIQFGKRFEVTHAAVSDWESGKSNIPNRVVEFVQSAKRKYLPATCQYCLADCNYTPLGPDKDKRCPVCGAAYTGPRRDEEFGVLLEAGLMAQED